MKLSKKAIVLVVLLLAAIGYTIYNYIIGQIDGNTAVLYVLVLCFPLVRMLKAFVSMLEQSQK